MPVRGRGDLRDTATKFSSSVPANLPLSHRMGEGQEFRWDKALAVADAIEDEELNRKLALRK